MSMMCRKCKKIITLSELGGYACGHFIALTIAGGFATYLSKALVDYFFNPTRGCIDETMAGACNGLGMACPKCKKTQAWDPYDRTERQVETKIKRQKKKEQILSL